MLFKHYLVHPGWKEISSVLICQPLDPFTATLSSQCKLKVIYHPLYSMNKFVTNKLKLQQDGAQVFPYMG